MIRWLEISPDKIKEKNKNIEEHLQYTNLFSNELTDLAQLETVSNLLVIHLTKYINEFYFGHFKEKKKENIKCLTYPTHKINHYLFTLRV